MVKYRNFGVKDDIIVKKRKKKQRKKRCFKVGCGWNGNDWIILYDGVNISYKERIEN